MHLIIIFSLFLFIQVCDNCVDRWAEQYPQRVALICEGDNSEESQVVTYREMQGEYREQCLLKVASGLL